MWAGAGDSSFHVTWFAPGFIEARVVCGVGNCRPGDVVGPDALFTVDTEPFLGSAEQAATGSARVNGVSYGGIPFVSFTGRLEFDGDPFVLASAGDAGRARARAMLPLRVGGWPCAERIRHLPL